MAFWAHINFHTFLGALLQTSIVKGHALLCRL